MQRVTEERPGSDDVPEVELNRTLGDINADLTIGAPPDAALPLRANEGLSSRGMALHGAGFIVSPEKACALGLGRVLGLEKHLRPYLNGRDLTQRSRGMMVIDLDGLSEQQVRRAFPDVYQHVLAHVKPERDQNNEPYRRENWWLFGRNNALLRSALRGLPRYIATVETAKHRVFCFLPATVLPDNMLVCIASDDALHLGVLSSRIHVAWALAAGGTLEDRPRYNKTRCFDPFPFPLASPAQRAAIAAIAEELDAHRRTRLDANPNLTITGLYNVLEKLRAGAPLTDAEREIHDQGHVSILRDLHDRLDREVAAAYGWRPDLSAPEIVARIVALNATRRAEEAGGVIHYLRPDFQAPGATTRAVQTALDVPEQETADTTPWPSHYPDQFITLRAALAHAPATPQDLTRRFPQAKRTKLKQMLETLVALGQAHRAQDGRYYR